MSTGPVLAEPPHTSSAPLPCGCGGVFDATVSAPEPWRRRFRHRHTRDKTQTSQSSWSLAACPGRSVRLGSSA
jgi:hypothetical protein